MGDPAINFKDANAGITFGFYHFDELAFKKLDPRIATFELSNSRVNMMSLES